MMKRFAQAAVAAALTCVMAIPAPAFADDAVVTPAISTTADQAGATLQNVAWRGWGGGWRGWAGPRVGWGGWGGGWRGWAGPRWGGGWGWRGWAGPRVGWGWRGWAGPGLGWGLGWGPGAGIIALGLGTALASSLYAYPGNAYAYGGYPLYYRYPPVVGGPYYRRPVARAIAYGGGHVARCVATYRSFNPRTNTFIGFDGRAHICRL